MRLLRLSAPVLLLFCLACQPAPSAGFAVVDGDQLRLVTGRGRTPAAVLAEAGVGLSPGDVLLLDGYPVALNASLSSSHATLQVLRTVSISVDGRNLQTTARTVGEALAQAGLSLRLADGVDPPPDAFVDAPLRITHTPARELVVHVDGGDRRVLSAASTVGGALAQAGLPLLDLDFSRPPADAPLPQNGQIQVVRVSESLTLSEKPIPFQSEYRDSPQVEVGQEQILQPGVQGLSVSRVRIRYEDGREVSRQTEAETVVRPPQDRITARGTRVVLKTATLGGVQVQYWLSLQMYATVYSPCNSGGGGCSYGTASGLRAGKGVVAVDPSLYAYLNGQRLFIPGYGPAVIGDVGGGYIVEQNLGVSRDRWIDLGFDDNNLTDMSGWVTVYFLAPAPAVIPEVLK